MLIAIGCDHGGINLKKEILAELEERRIDVIDCGCNEGESVDYPDNAYNVAKFVARGKCDKGILMCGTGIGISIAANKVKSIRCAVCHDEWTAEMCSKHNNANIISLGGRIVSPELARKMVAVWLDTEFEGGRHIGRLDKISKIEEENFIENNQKLICKRK